jgi:hypothetical protein
MSEKNQHNPFEKHINSDSFDVDSLDRTLPRSEMDLEMEQFFDKLPYPLNHELWDTELDDRQKLICVHLATELIDRVMRVYYEDMLDDLSDDQLIFILTVPITLAILSQQRLHKPEAREQKEFVLVPPPLKEEKAPPPLRSKLRQGINKWLFQAQKFIIHLFRNR